LDRNAVAGTSSGVIRMIVTIRSLVIGLSFLPHMSVREVLFDMQCLQARYGRRPVREGRLLESHMDSNDRIPNG
jgi:hypothetical protein